MSTTAVISPETRQAIRDELAKDRLLYRLPPPTDALFRQQHMEFFGAAVKVGWPMVIIMFSVIIVAAWLQFHDDMHGWDGQVWWYSIAFCSLIYAIVLPAMQVRAVLRYHVLVSGVGASLFLASQLASAMLIRNPRFAQELTYVCMINNFSAMLAWGLPPLAGVLTCLAALPIAIGVAMLAGVSPDLEMTSIYYLGSVLVLFMAALMLDRSERLGFLQGLLLKHEIDENGRLITQLDSRNGELARAIGDLKSAQAQLVQSEKMASLGQMIAGVAHEVNTPLGYVKNNVTVLREFVGQLRDVFPPPPPDENGEPDFSDPGMVVDDMAMALDDTVYGIDQISQLVVGLKDFSRLDQAKVASASLNKCVEAALVLTRHVLKEKFQVVQQLGNVPAVPLAPSQINQVLLNLITNAAQAMDSGGTLTITTGYDDKNVFVIVADTGKGMPAEVQKHIFDPFYTTKPVGEGTGLGLSIAWQIVQAHEGNITVESREGVGTSFCITLPRENRIADNVEAVTAAA